jgi:hypothetical protein
MGNSVAKLSVSVPNDLAKAVRKRVGTRGLSGFVARAMRHQLEHEQLASYLAEMDELLGPVPNKALVAARAAWPKR